MTGQLQWQIDQGAKCGCRGHDDYCPCQNVDFSAPPTLQGDVAASEHHAVLKKLLRLNGILPPAWIEEEARELLGKLFSEQGHNTLSEAFVLRAITAALASRQSVAGAIAQSPIAAWSKAAQLHARALAAEAEVRRLREALEKYGEHQGACAQDLCDPACTCGLDVAPRPATIADRTGEGEADA